MAKGILRYGHVPVVLWVLLAVALAGCSVPTGGRVIGGQPVQVSELAAYPGGVELANGESQVLDPLFRAAQEEPPPFIGLGIEVVKQQRTFRLPSDTTFSAVKAFYADKLQSAGWREDGAMRVFMNAANAANPSLQGGIWVRIDQTLLIAMATDPRKGQKELMLSLATR